MKKLFSVLCILSLVFTFFVPVFATEVGDPFVAYAEEVSGATEEPSESPSDASEDTEPSEGTSEPTEEPIEPSESPSDGLGDTEPSEGASEPAETPVTPPVLSLDGATVNVSDSSISAIAEAVTNAQSDVGVSFTLSNDRIITIPSHFMEYWDDYTYHLIFANSSSLSSTITVIFCNTLVSQYYNSEFRCSDYAVTENALYSDATFSFSDSERAFTFYSSRAYWADFDYYDRNGSLFIKSSLATYYTVSFNTGFSDLVLPSVSSIDFVLPEVTYSGYDFGGWYLDEDFTLPYPDNYVFTQDIVLYAKFVPYRTISFVSGFDDYILNNITVLDGEPYIPPEFSYPGYEYLGAYIDDTFETPFVGGTEVNDDLTLYLRFEPIQYNFGLLISETNTLLMAILIVLCIWTSAYVWNTLLRR